MSPTVFLHNVRPSESLEDHWCGVGSGLGGCDPLCCIFENSIHPPSKNQHGMQINFTSKFRLRRPHIGGNSFLKWLWNIYYLSKLLQALKERNLQRLSVFSSKKNEDKFLKRKKNEQLEITTTLSTYRWLWDGFCDFDDFYMYPWKETMYIELFYSSLV